MKYALSSVLINSYRPGLITLCCFDSGRLEKLGEHTYELVVKKNERGNPEVYPFDLGIKREDILTIRTDPHDNRLIRYRLIPILGNSEGKDLLSRIREHLPRK